MITMGRMLVQLPDSVMTGDLDQDGTISLGELLASAIVAALLLAVILNVVVQGVGLLVLRGDWPWLTALGANCAVAVVAGGVLGIWRMLRYELGLHYWRDDRARQRELEDEDRAFRLGLTDDDRQARISQADVDEAVWLMLRAWFETSTFARGKVPGVSETRWNLANEVLKASGLRRGRRMDVEAETIDEAWARYLLWRRSARSHYVTSEGDLIAKG